MTIGEKIKQAREAKGYTQEEFGKLVGVQRSAVTKWEKNRVSNIGRTKLQLIAEVLNIPAYELVLPDSSGKEDQDADFHSQILLDAELLGSIREYYTLSKKEQENVRSIIHALALQKGL